jgi:hypothetical protein
MPPQVLFGMKKECLRKIIPNALPFHPVEKSPKVLTIAHDSKFQNIKATENIDLLNKEKNGLTSYTILI